MVTAKDIIVKPITKDSADKIVKRIHYSGKIVNSSLIHFGAFIGEQCYGAMQFGCPMDKRKTIKLVSGTKWNQMLELNRMAFGPELPRNSESRCLAIAFRLLKNKYPYLKWIISFADGTQCGDGTIYRASGFVLTAIKPNRQIMKLDSGEIIARKTLDNFNSVKIRGGYKKTFSYEYLPGYQFRYVYFIDKTYRSHLTVAEIPFSKIAEIGATMYKGKKRATSIDIDVATNQVAEGGASPTVALQI